MSSKTATIVTGLPDDGLAALARTLCDAEDAALPDAEGIHELGDRILAAFGLSWDRPGPVVVPGLSRAAADSLLARSVETRFLRDMVDRIAAIYGDASRIVVPEPRYCILPGLYRRALESLGYDVRTILAMRSPLAAAAALQRARSTPLPKALRLWAQYAVAALRDGASGDLRVVEPDGPAGETPSAARGADPAGSPLVAPLVSDVYGLLAAWDRLDAAARSAGVAAAAARLEDALVLGGHVALTAPSTFAIPDRGTAGGKGGGAARRAVIVHYHLFKNAGTSIDAMLKQNFAAGWVSREFEAGSAVRSPADLAAFIADHPEVSAISSHSALLPAPVVEGVDVFPIVFLRHPIDRLASAYRFERAQGADTLGAELARRRDFAGYLRGLLAAPNHRVARNFQTWRLAHGSPGGGDREADRARRTVETLPFVGLVEAYEASVDTLGRLLEPMFPGIQATVYRQNATRTGESDLSARLERIADEIGVDLYAELLAANADDLELFGLVSRRYRATAAPGGYSSFPG